MLKKMPQTSPLELLATVDQARKPSLHAFAVHYVKSKLRMKKAELIMLQAYSLPFFFVIFFMTHA